MDISLSRSHLVAEQVALIAVNRKAAFARKAQNFEQQLILIAKNREAAIQRRALHPRLRPWAVRPHMANAMDSDLRGAGELQPPPSSCIGSSPGACEFDFVFAPSKHLSTVQPLHEGQSLPKLQTCMSDEPPLHVVTVVAEQFPSGEHDSSFENTESFAVDQRG